MGLKVKGWKKICHGNSNQKRDWVAILVSKKIQLNSKTVTRDKKEYYIMIKSQFINKM